MYLSGVHWSAVTSHHKWIFLRRVENPVGLRYSTVELQENNTRPFLALLAMFLAAQGAITVSPPEENDNPLSRIEQSQSDAEPNSNRYSSGGYDFISKSISVSTCPSPLVTDSHEISGEGGKLQVLLHLFHRKNF